MGRKSVADIRRQEILDAYEACVRSYGFHQSSTRKIAEIAGVKQPAIAHYFGSKANLVQALVERVQGCYMSLLEQTLAGTTGEQRLEKVLDWLYGPVFLGPQTKQRPLAELLAAVRRDDELRQKVVEMYNTFLSACQAELHRAFPGAPEERLRQVAYGVLSMGSGNDLMASVGLAHTNRNLARRCAEQLIRGLQQ